ncbi:hypothetical protein ABW20_dc0109849 [Dactylellina cionopaga]|nr:hypothetical protein ABW20_dc0109849 [Dactylellina cionopaga]
MLSPIRELENKPTSPPRESKPSLTIYAHKIATQTSEIRSLLTSSLAHISEDHDTLRQTLQDTRSLISSHDVSSKQFEGVVGKLDGIVTKQQDTLSLLAQTLNNMETDHSLIQEELGAITVKLNVQNARLEKALNGMDEMAESIKNIDSKICEFQNESTSIPKPEFQHQHISLDTVPTLLVQTGQAPVLSDTEVTHSSDISIVADTPAPANKPIKKPPKISLDKIKQVDKRKKSLSSTQRALRRSKRHRSISLGLAIEATPDEREKTHVGKGKDTYSNVDYMKVKAEEVSEGPRDLPKPKTNSSQKAADGSKEQPKKRILAGPATQEAWELDSET